MKIKEKFNNASINCYTKTVAFLKSEKGQGILEYIIILAVVSLGVLYAIIEVKDKIEAKLKDAANKIDSAK